MEKYWDNRFRQGGMIWGKEVSQSAKQARDLFEKETLENILVPGSGYGRHTIFFREQGYKVEGIEISEEAIRLAEANNSEINYHKGSVLDMPFSEMRYGGLYCFNVLHLFKGKDRKLFIKHCSDALMDNGVAYFTVFSESEPSYGKGKEIEKNTFESKIGRPVHYFTEVDLLDHFKTFDVIQTGIIEETENHGKEGKHLHVLRYIYVRKL